MNVGDLISVDELEREHIRIVISKTKNLGEAARILGIDAATLYRKRKRWGMGKDRGEHEEMAPPPMPVEAEAGKLA
jgi:DNA-binding NtrC family response regulator